MTCYMWQWQRGRSLSRAPNVSVDITCRPEMCMGMGTIGIPSVPWDSHGNGSDNDCIIGMGMGVGIKVCEWE